MAVMPGSVFGSGGEDPMPMAYRVDEDTLRNLR